MIKTGTASNRYSRATVAPIRTLPPRAKKKKQQRKKQNKQKKKKSTV